jgi:hypothetical protein
LWSFGLKKAAVARLCLNLDINRAMPEVCVKYLPAPGFPAPPVAASYAQAEASADIRDIWVVEGAAGKIRHCNDYDVTQQRCRVWAHVAHHSTPKKNAAASGKNLAHGGITRLGTAVAEIERKEKSQ